MVAARAVVLLWIVATAVAAANLTLSPSACTPTASCREALEAAFRACHPALPCNISLLPGTYAWDPSPGVVYVSNLTAVTVSGEGAVIDVVPGTALSGLLDVSFVTGFTVRGVTITASRAPFTFGVVTGVNASGVSVAFNASAYPFPGDIPWLATAPHVYGAINETSFLPRLPMLWRGGGAITLTSPSALYMEASGMPPAIVGHHVVLEHSRSHTAFSLTHVRDVVFANVTLESNPGFGFYLVRCHNVDFSDTRIVPPDGRPMSTMADGIHLRLCSGDVLFRGVVVERNGDDCIALHNGYHAITGFPDAGDRSVVTVAAVEPLDVVAGEPWGARHGADLGLLSDSLTVTSADFAGKRLRFSAPLPASIDVGDVLTSLTRPSTVVVAGATLWGNLGHGIRIKVPDVVVEDSIIGGNSFMPVLMLPDASFWMSSLAVRNVTLRNNTLHAGGVWADAQYDVDATSVTVTAYAGEAHGAPVAASDCVNSDVRLVSNTILQAPGVTTALLMRATCGFVVANNTVVWATGPATLVHALNSNGTVSGNVCVVGGAAVPCVETHSN